MTQSTNASNPHPLDPSLAYASHAIRLSARELLVVGLVCVSVLLAVPRVWRQVESFEPEPDYRVPYAASEDYWVYRRWAETVAAQGRVLVIGDSVVWGEYVTPDQTLTHYLNERAGAPRFANGGLNGSHPLALGGLVRDFTQAIADTHVILHCNLLWLSAPNRDLQIDDDSVQLNHPELLPQLLTDIPAYNASFADRIGAIVDRTVDFRAWVRHMRHAHWDGMDLHNWTLVYPYRNPAAALALALPSPGRTLRHRPVPWTEQGIPRQDMDWVSTKTSKQYPAFQGTVRRLRARGNRLFVIIGPFNEHLLTDAGVQHYRTWRDAATAWLESEQVPHVAPSPLPSDEYGDASHPLSAGYHRLADSLFANQSFQLWMAEK